MIKSIYKGYLNKKNAIKVTNNTISYFSTKLAPQKERLEDWQYVQQISKQIKDNDINEALSYLIQSHLNNQILNKQIYYSLHQKMQQTSVTTGYHEILYHLYRQHFQPNPMTLGWMKRISKTQNPKLNKILKEDFKKINQVFPINIPHNGQGKQSKSVQNQNLQEQQTKPQSLGRKSRKVLTVASTDEYFSKSPQTIIVKKRGQSEQKISQKIGIMKENESTAEGVEQAIVQKFQQVMQMMFKEYGKVTLHNVELQIDFGTDQGPDLDEEINEMYNENDVHEDQHQHDEHQHDGQESMDDLLLETISSIKKIKIGKIEFQNSHTLETFKNIKNDFDNDPKTQK